MSVRNHSENEQGYEVHLYQKILANLHEGYILSDENGAIREVNSAYCKLVGYRKDELVGKHISEVEIKFNDEEIREVINEVNKKGYLRFETIHKTKKDEQVYFDVSMCAIRVNDEWHRVAFLRDITQQKEDRERLEETRQQFRSLFEHNPHAVYYMDLEGNYLGINSKMEELTGYSRDELLSLHFAPLITDKDLEKTQTHFEKAAGGHVQEYEIEGITKQGEAKPVRITNFPMIISGDVTGVFGIAEDITERRQAEKKIKESEQRWHRLVEDNPKPMQITVEAKIVFINEAGVKLYEADSAEDLLGKYVLDFCHPDDLAELEQRKYKLENQLPVNQIHENRIITLTGDERVIEVHSIPISYKEENAIQTVIYDITERKHKEKLLQSSLEEKKIMLQEIHHRVKNNMAVVSGLLELQAMNTEDKVLQKTLKESQLRIYSMAMIHEKLYASKSLAEISFDEYAQELVKAITSSLKDINPKVQVRYRMDSGRLNINEAIPCALILNELVVNCYKHAFVDQTDGTILISLSRKDGKVIISVEDNGIGIPDDFKIENQQTLGMTIVQTLVRQLNGELIINTGNNRPGTCFIIIFTEHDL